MSVGGRLIEILPMHAEDGDEVLRLWVVGQPRSPCGVGDETCVYAKPQESLPKLGDEIWWQCGKIYFDGDRQHLKKVGFSFAPRPAPDGQPVCNGGGGRCCQIRSS